MRILMITLFATCIIATACNNNNPGHSTPIDSTNVNGTAPATYAPNNPANDQDTTLANSSDTGSNPSNLHHEGYDTAINRKNASGSH